MYAIKDWNSVFENNKSRTFDTPSYVNWPVRRDSEAFATLMHDASGIAAFGIFGALVQWMGKRPASVRKYGILADDNRKHVAGFTHEVLTDKAHPRIEVEIVEVAS